MIAIISTLCFWLVIACLGWYINYLEACHYKQIIERLQKNVIIPDEVAGPKNQQDSELFGDLH